MRISDWSSDVCSSDLPKEYPRRVLWPDASDMDKMIKEQREEFHKAFGKIYKEGGWTVAIDEAWWFTNILGLGEDLKIFLLQGRAMGISLLAATQRHSKIPLEFYDQSERKSKRLNSSH